MGGTRKKKKWIMLPVAMILLLIFFARVGNFAPLENIMLRATTPVTATALYAWRNVAAFGIATVDMRNIAKEAAVLREENQRLRADTARRAELEHENEALRKQLGVAVPRSRVLMDADVVAFDPLFFTHYAVINRGARDGVKEQMPVIMPGNVVFGKISSVHETTSEVMLISDGSNKASVKTVSEKASGVLGGSSGGVLLLDLVEKSAELSPDELVVTSGLDGTYPRGLTVGWVTKIISQEEGIFKQAYLRPAYTEALPFMVFIITNQQK